MCVCVCVLAGLAGFNTNTEMYPCRNELFYVGNRQNATSSTSLWASLQLSSISPVMILAEIFSFLSLCY